MFLYITKNLVAVLKFSVFAWVFLRLIMYKQQQTILKHKYKLKEESLREKFIFNFKT